MPNWGGAGKGALGGAATGSMFGPWGTVAGAGIGGVMGMFSGGDDEDDEKKKAAGDATSDIDALRTASAETRKKAGTLSNTGNEAIAPVMQQLKAMLGNDPAAMMEATKPERGRVIDQYDTARRAAATFGPRGGGTNAAIGESHFQQASDLGDITSMAKRDATAQLGQLGAQMTGLGLSADQLASADLNSVIGAVLGRESLDLQKRGQNMQMWGEVGSAAGDILGSYMTRDGGAWGKAA